MRFGVYIGNFGWGANVADLLEIAEVAEEAGWDGFFLWDHVNFPGVGGRHADPWVALGVIASRTQDLLLGTAITPLPRRRPTKLAQEVLTLDEISGGRFILGVGNGMGDPSEFGDLGDEADLHRRAEMLDEGLEVLQGLLSDEKVAFDGHHFRVHTAGFGPPVSGRRIPIWVGATWPKKKPSRRATRFDGIFPILDPFTLPMLPEHVREIAAFVAAERESDEPFDIVVAVQGVPEDLTEARKQAAAFAEAGTTWYTVPCFPPVEPKARFLDRVRRGPPRP